MSSLHKKSGALDLLPLANPLYTLAGTREVENALPRLSEERNVNKVLWNSAGVGVSALAVAALISALSNETKLSKYKKKSDEALGSKLNSIMPIASPDTDLNDLDERAKRRLLELSKTASSDRKPTVGEGMAARVITSAIPVMVGLGGLYAGNKVVNKLYESRIKEDTKKQIAEYSNELEALQARILQLQMSENSKGNQLETDDLYKLASSETLGEKVGRLGDNIATAGGIIGPNIKTTGSQRNILQLLIDMPFLSALLIGGATAGVGYNLFSKRDEDTKKLKELESMAATNLSNIPPRLVLALDKNGNPMVKGSTEIA